MTSGYNKALIKKAVIVMPGKVSQILLCNEMVILTGTFCLAASRCLEVHQSHP